MNANNATPNSNVSNKNLFEKQFPKEPSAYHFGDTESSDKEAGKDQIMKAVNIISEFDEDLSCEPDREFKERFPETEDELKGLVEEIFNEDFIDELKWKEGYSLEDNEYSEDGEENGSEDGSSSSESDGSTPNSSSISENNDTEVFAELPTSEDGGEDGEKDEHTDEEEEEQQTTTRITRQTKASDARRRITDEKPGTRSVTAQGAGFSGEMWAMLAESVCPQLELLQMKQA